MRLLVQALLAMAAVMSMGQCVATEPPFTSTGYPFVTDP